jgi:pimeloyl-ACP methyl ester carboxylesterase
MILQGLHYTCLLLKRISFARPNGMGQLAVTGLGFLLLCSSRPTFAQPSADLSITTKVFEVGSLRMDAELGSFSVPERHSAPRGRRIKLAFLRYKTTAARPGPPILYLAGGPGTSGINYATSQRFEQYLTLRQFGDVIALNQRGTDHSEPSLKCPTMLEFPAEREATKELLLKAYSASAASCASYWKHQGVDLSAYNTEESAHDVKILADALGIKTFILFGASYGSHLGLAILRYHPELVQRAVLGGIEGPDHTFKLPANGDLQLDAVSHLIAADPVVGRILPDFKTMVVALINRLSADPVDVPIDSPGSSPHVKTTLRLSAVDVQLLVASLLGNRDGIASIPRIFWPATHGDYSSIASIVARDSRKVRISAMSEAMDCASNSSPERWNLIERQRRNSALDILDFPLPEGCSAWDVGKLPGSFRSPVQSSVPVLFIAGTLDGRTPVSNAVEVRNGFPNGVLFVVQGAGHDSSLFRSSPELIQSIDRFFAGGEAEDSVFKAPPIRFEHPVGESKAPARSPQQ